MIKTSFYLIHSEDKIHWLIFSR